jgi:hypothetical protein
MVLENPSTGDASYSRSLALVLVDGYDLAVAAALRYAESQHPTVLRAVHFTIDPEHADRLRERWLAAAVAVPLELADCPDRRLAHAAAALVAREAAVPGTFVTVVLPRASYPPLAGHVLHDHTGDRIAHLVSRVPQAVTIIVPFDVRNHAEANPASTARARLYGCPGRLLGLFAARGTTFLPDISGHAGAGELQTGRPAANNPPPGRGAAC